VGELCNLVVELDERFDGARAPADPAGVEIVPAARAGERVLAWIDAEFGGSWSSEAHASVSALALRDGAPVGFASFDPRGLRFRWLRGLARLPGVGVFGPFGVAAGERGRGIGRALLHRALRGLRERGYTRALIAAVSDDRLVEYYARAAGARVAERFDWAALTAPRPRVTLMASGSGTNVQAVLDRAADGRLPIDVVATVVNAERAYAAQRARDAGVARVTSAVWDKRRESRAQYDDRLLHCVREDAPDLVLLLGWMHLLDETFVRAFPELLNVHPAYLPLDPARDDVGLPDGTRIPAFRGARAVRDALSAGSPWTGATVHRVTPSTDRGPVMTRKPLKVGRGEDEAAVTARLHPVEHELVAGAIRRWLYERDG